MVDRGNVGGDGGKMGDDSVYRIVAQHLAIAPEQARDSGDLWSSGLTSLAAVRILMDLEDEFRVTFPPESLSRETFASTARLAEALEAARAQPQGTLPPGFGG